MNAKTAKKTLSQDPGTISEGQKKEIIQCRGQLNALNAQHSLLSQDEKALVGLSEADAQQYLEDLHAAIADPNPGAAPANVNQNPDSAPAAAPLPPGSIAAGQRTRFSARSIFAWVAGAAFLIAVLIIIVLAWTGFFLPDDKSVTAKAPPVAEQKKTETKAVLPTKAIPKKSAPEIPVIPKPVRDPKAVQGFIDYVQGTSP